MNKKIIIIFSLILSILFINITPVYCIPAIDFEEETETDDGQYIQGPNFEDEKYPFKFDYNVFNPNIIPLFINKETGEGFYYTGYIPEITFKENKINSSDYENLVENIVEYNVGAEDDPKIPENEIYLAYNSKKTHLYYHIPKSNFLELICNGSRFYEGQTVYDSNVYLYLKNFVGFGVTDSSYSFLQSFLDSGWEFMNYVLTQSDSMRLYDVKYGDENSLLGVYPQWLENSFPYYVEKYKYTILDFHQNIYFNNDWEYSLTTNITNSYYYDYNSVSIRDLYTAFYSENNIYDDDCYLLFKYRISFNQIHLPEGDLGIAFDFYNTYTGKYERVYTSYKKLLEVGLIDESLELIDSIETYKNNINNQVILKVRDIKRLSHLGDIEDIQILGFNVYWEMENNNTYDNTLKTYTYSHSISNSCYVTFNFKDTTQNTVANSVKIYRLDTNCYNWSRYYVSNTITTEDTPVSDGIPGNESLDGLLNGLDISSLIESVGEFPSALRLFFIKIPPVFISLFVFSVALFCISAIIHYIRR